MKILMIVLCLVFLLQLSATIINIPVDYAHIQQGINASIDGDTVLVQPGTYFENINYYGHNIVIASMFFTTHDSSQIEQTIIDGSQDGRVVTFENNENSTAMLIGFTIRNGYVYGNSYPDNRGGGISIDSSSPTLNNLIVTDNYAFSAGGISFWDNANATLNSVSIIDNFCFDNSGGIHFSNSNPTLTNIVIRSNFAYSKSGGAGFSACSPTLVNVLVVDNTALEKGGAFYLSSEAWPLLKNVTICNNNSSWSAIHCDSNSRPDLINCILWNNSPSEVLFDNGGDILIAYSDVRLGWEGVGNINENPVFVETGEHRYSLHEGSPCIDSGVPDTSGLNLPPYDIISNLRIWDGDVDGIAVIDMGAYEYGASPYVDVENNVIVQSKEVYLSQNYPNPFNPFTTIDFSIQNDSNIDLSIYNIKGQKIKTLAQDYFEKGNHSIIWDGKDTSGKKVSTGMYLYKLRVNDETELVKKCLLLK